MRRAPGIDPSSAIVDELAYVPPEVWESVTGATGKRDRVAGLGDQHPAAE